MKIYNELESLGFFEWLDKTHDLRDTDMKPEYLDKLPLNDIHRTVCNSMAFRWFRDKKLSDMCICRYQSRDDGGIYYYYHITHDFGVEETKHYKEGFFSYEEAELACLRKLIEIVKNK